MAANRRRDERWQKIIDSLTDKLMRKLKPGPKYHGKLSNENTVLSILSTPIVVELIEEWLDKQDEVDKAISEKDFSKGEYFRTEGNKFYVTDMNLKALEFYNDSIRHYPLNGIYDPGEKHGLAFAYANRSAVFYNQEKYIKCLDNIERSFRCNYPENLRHKLLKRKAECLIELGEFEQARIALSESKKVLCDENLQIKNRDKFISSIDSLWKKILNSDPNEKKRLPKDQSEHVFKVTYKNNKMFENASDGVELKYSESAGRYLCSSKAFKPGDVVIKEEAYASVLLQRFNKTHCQYCFREADNMVPCPHCCLFTYCSEPCQKASWKDNHYVECHHLVKLQGIGIATAALRLLLNTSFEKLCEVHFANLCQADDESLPYGVESEKFITDYESVYNLPTHIQEMPFHTIIQNGLMAVALLFVLRRSNFFQRPQVKQWKEKIDTQYKTFCKDFITNANGAKSSQIDLTELLYGSLLCKHIHQIICNGIAVTGIYDLQDSVGSNISKHEHVRFGTGIFPTASLMNHSCDPNCIQTFVGNTVIIKVTKEVNENQELTISYGPIFNRQSRQERQGILKEQYFFTCTCEKCKNEPHGQIYLYYKCQNCEGPIPCLDDDACKRCEKPFDKEWYTDLHLKSSAMISNCLFPREEQVKTIEECLKIQQQIYYKYNRNLGNSYNCLACALAAKGRYSEAKSYFEKALKIVEITYGTESLEVGDNLVTYSDLLWSIFHEDMMQCNMSGDLPNFCVAKECLQVVRRAYKILSISTSMTLESQQMIDLKEKEQFLAGIFTKM